MIFNKPPGIQPSGERLGGIARIYNVVIFTCPSQGCNECENCVVWLEFVVIIRSTKEVMLEWVVSNDHSVIVSNKARILLAITVSMGFTSWKCWSCGDGYDRAVLMN